METQATIRRSRNLKNFYLDPNNYRFVDNDNYKVVDPSNLTDVNIQKRARTFIEGKNRAGIKDLLDSFRANGFLNVDVIQLKDLGENRYLVLEGNRRVTALKALQEDHSNGLDIGRFDPAAFKNVPSEIYSNDDTNHLIIMGLKHISGNKKWPAINQAKLIYDYLEPHWEDGPYYEEEERLCESLGITKHKLRTSQRTYHLILQYKSSDYGDQFESDMYYTFTEIVKKPTIKKWIEWSDDDYFAHNEENIARLFSWLSEVEEESEVEEDDLDFSKKTLPIIDRYRDIQDLAKFIDNEDALQIMEERQSVAHGLIASGSIEEESLDKNIDKIRRGIVELSRLKKMMGTDDLETVKGLHKEFQGLIPREYSIDMQSNNGGICFDKGKVSHFSEITVSRYKAFKDFSIKNLNRINILAGFNNCGKTSILEAVYLLSKQNNSGAFFELTKLRHKLSELNTRYMNESLQEPIGIQGRFNSVASSVSIKKYSDSTIDQKDDYLASYQITGSIDNDVLNSLTHTFIQSPLQRYSDKVEVLCRSSFKSPYIFNKEEELLAHDENVTSKNIDRIIKFIKENIDDTINYIELSDKMGGMPRFMVDTSRFPEKAVDLTTYGEGLQRIWDIALAFSYCRNGVLLIDELETAIHSTLLGKFSIFIQELSDIFNVQVFITSHSKECIDAFVLNDFRNDDISGYFMDSTSEGIEAIFVSGSALKDLIESGFDLRGEGDE